jgi:2-amino-4-hydroxy-6-hydroxymethyldihydropteridine diphosphokinase
VSAKGTRALLGLGSNIVGRWHHLANALSALSNVDADLASSGVYESAPVGGPADQPPYLNLVVSLLWAASPLALLELAQQLEQQAGRVRLVRWGPRSLDVDLLLVDGVECDTPELCLPHPRWRERAFVLAPLEEVAPDLVPATWRDDLGGELVLAGAIRRVGAIIPSTDMGAGSASDGRG